MHATTCRRPARRRRGVALLGGLAVAAAALGLPSPAAAGLQSGALVAATPAVAAATPAVAAAAPAGPVGSTACTGAGPTTCTLFAKSGTATLPGAAPTVWGFTADAAGDLTGPGGPVLVVTSGTSVTVELHNGLADPLALAFPGVGGLTDDLVGAAAGAVKSYTFTAPAPGTYVYEAGHTDLGARQVAMGLAGVLVVRPAGFDPAAPTQDGTNDTAFGDEAVLALSEIDPAFNAAPRTFDLRKYHPAYRLINGAVAPNIAPIATAHGRTTLLRYANLGLLGHAMGVSGAKQQVLAVDGYADTGRVSLVADMIAPGQTEDTRVAYPVGGPSRMPVYETAGTLDNGGLASSTGSLVVGFGGMLTFLATDATSTGGDTTGPTVSAVAVDPSTLASPNATNAVTASATDVGSGDSTIAAAELWVDSPAPNFGGGAAMTVATPGSSTSALSGSVPAAMLQGLSQGQHRVYVRAQDQAGNWGAVSSTQLTLASTGAATTHLSVTPSPTNGSRDVTLTATGDDSAIGGTVDAAEYYVGSTSGAPHAMTVGAASTVVAETATIPQATVLNLAEGAQTISVRTHDSAGLWGPFATVTLGLDRTGPGTSGTAVTPGTTDGTVGDPVDPTSLKVHASFVDPVAPVTTGIASPVTGAEGFLDSAGADGSGFVFVADDGQWNAVTESGYGLIPLSQLTGLANGTHTVYVHAKDAAGNWGPLASGTFTLQRGPAVLLSDYFESGNLATWATTTGNVSNAASTALGGARVLKAQGSNAYVTGPAFSPAVTTLKAEVMLSPQSLVTGSGWVDLAQARSGGTVVAAIQYHRQTTTGIRQVRLMVRSGTTNRTSNAVTVSSTGATTLRLDWSAGTGRTDTLAVNGVVAQSLTNVSAANQSVDTVRLGVIGTATSSTGFLYLDSFIATK